MNFQQLRQSLKIKWLSYYYENRPWLVKMQIWGNYDGERRPTSGFMLATLSVLEPQLDQIFPFILDLNNNPDRIVAALGLNFNPDQQLHLIKSENPIATTEVISDRSSHSTAQTGDRQLLVRDAVTTEVESKDTELLCVATEVESNDKPERSLAFATKVETKGKPKPLGFTTKVETKGKPDTKSHSKTSPPNVSPWRKEGKKSVAPLPGDVIRMNATCERSRAVTKFPSNGKPVAVATKIASQDKRVKMPRKDVPAEVNLPPTTSASTLASWIDEFCEGAD